MSKMEIHLLSFGVICYIEIGNWNRSSERKKKRFTLLFKFGWSHCSHIGTRRKAGVRRTLLPQEEVERGGPEPGPQDVQGARPASVPPR